MNHKSLYKPPFHVSLKIDRSPTSKVVQPLIYTGAATGPVARSYLREKHNQSLNAADQFLATRQAFISLGLTLGENYKKPEFQNIMLNRGNEESEEKSVVERKLQDAKNAEIIKNTKPPKKSFFMTSKKLIQERSKESNEYENFQEFSNRILLKVSKGNSSEDEDDKELEAGSSAAASVTHKIKGKFGKLDDATEKQNAATFAYLNPGITDATIRKKFRDHEARMKPKKTRNTRSGLDNFNPMVNINKILRQGALLLDESSKIGQEPGKDLSYTGPSFDEHYFQDYKPSSTFLPETNDAVNTTNPLSTRSVRRNVKFNKSKSREDPRNKKSQFNDYERVKSVYTETILTPLPETPAKLGKSRTPTSARSKDNTYTKPFDGLKISSLVSNGAAAVLGYQGKSKDYEDVMNPIQEQLVEEMTNYELSSFLPKGHGHRPNKLGLRLIEPRKDKTEKSPRGLIGASQNENTNVIDDEPSWIKFKKITGKYKSKQPAYPQISPGLALTTAAMKQAELRAQRIQQRQVYIEQRPNNPKPKLPERKNTYFMKNSLKEADSPAMSQPPQIFSRVPFATAGRIGKLGDGAEMRNKGKLNASRLSAVNLSDKTKSEIVRRPGVRY